MISFISVSGTYCPPWIPNLPFCISYPPDNFHDFSRIFFPSGLDTAAHIDPKGMISLNRFLHIVRRDASGKEIMPPDRLQQFPRKFPSGAAAAVIQQDQIGAALL